MGEFADRLHAVTHHTQRRIVHDKWYMHINKHAKALCQNNIRLLSMIIYATLHRIDICTDGIACMVAQLRLHLSVNFVMWHGIVFLTSYSFRFEGFDDCFNWVYSQCRLLIIVSSSFVAVVWHFVRVLALLSPSLDADTPISHKFIVF